MKLGACFLAMLQLAGQGACRSDHRGPQESNPSRSSRRSKMSKAAGIWLTFALLADLGCSSWSALWPLKDYLTQLKRFKTAIELYSPAESNLDVLLVSVFHCTFLLVEVCVVAGRGRSQATDGKGWGGPLAKFICAFSQVSI